LRVPARTSGSKRNAWRAAALGEEPTVDFAAWPTASDFAAVDQVQLIADSTPHLEPALVETMDLAQSASIRKSSAVFVALNKSTNWGFDRLGKAIREINDAVYGFDVSQFREGFQFTRYEVGEYYGPHFDIGPGKLAERKLS
jgi:hypothetical protein